MISIAAFHAAFEQYDYSMASAIAMIMAAVELLVIGAVLACAAASTAAPTRREGLMAARPEARRELRRGAGDGSSPRPGAWLAWGAVAFFMLHLAGRLGSVVVNSFATSWFGAWLPQGYDHAVVRRRLGRVRASATCWP